MFLLHRGLALYRRAGEALSAGLAWRRPQGGPKAAAGQKSGVLGMGHIIQARFYPVNGGGVAAQAVIRTKTGRHYDVASVDS